jgi:hypothetical protein
MPTIVEEAIWTAAESAAPLRFRLRHALGELTRNARPTAVSPLRFAAALQDTLGGVTSNEILSVSIGVHPWLKSAGLDL